MAKVSDNKPPTHPGEMLLGEYLYPVRMTQRELADALHVPFQRVNEIIRGRRGITPSTALRLEKFFGVPAILWLTDQMNWDLYQVLQNEEEVEVLK